MEQYQFKELCDLLKYCKNFDRKIQRVKREYEGGLEKAPNQEEYEKKFSDKIYNLSFEHYKLISEGKRKLDSFLKNENDPEIFKAVSSTTKALEDRIKNISRLMSLSLSSSIGDIFGGEK